MPPQDPYAAYQQPAASADPYAAYQQPAAAPVPPIPAPAGTPPLKNMPGAPATQKVVPDTSLSTSIMVPPVGRLPGAQAQPVSTLDALKTAATGGAIAAPFAGGALGTIPAMLSNAASAGAQSKIGVPSGQQDQNQKSASPEFNGSGNKSAEIAAGIAGALPLAGPAFTAARRGLGLLNPAEAGQIYGQFEPQLTKTPVATDAARKVALEAQKLHEIEGGMPTVLKNYLLRTAPIWGDAAGTLPPESPILYPEGRQTASAAGRLSAEARAGASPQMQKIVSSFAKVLSDANREGAETQGLGKFYDYAQKMYAGAKGREEMLANIAKYGKDAFVHSIIYGALGAGAGAAYGAYKVVTK